MQSKLIILAFSFFFVIQNQSFAQSKKMPSSFLVAIEQDNNFGFYPSMFGSFGIRQILQVR